MNRAELKKLIRGTIATIPTPFDDQYRLDLGRVAELTHWWVANGLGTSSSPIKVAAAMGEGPDLSDDEWPALLRTVVNAAGAGAVIMCGLKTKNTLHTIDDAKRAADLGAAGVQIDLPVFHHSNQDDYVRYFSDISEKIDIGILIYNTWWFGADSITAQTMLRLKDAEHVTAVKWAVPAHMDYDDMRQFAHIFNVIDNAGMPVRCHKNGGAGYISSHVAVYPPHDLKIWRLLEARRYDEAQAEWDRVERALAPLNAKSSKRSGGYRFIKGMMAAMGRPVGPTRPPTLPMDEAEIAELRPVLRSIGWLA
jgi:dihydrodipicolinate synthase/N-acetylneuraminate lyase